MDIWGLVCVCVRCAHTLISFCMQTTPCMVRDCQWKGTTKKKKSEQWTKCLFSMQCMQAETLAHKRDLTVATKVMLSFFGSLSFCVFWKLLSYGMCLVWGWVGWFVLGGS